MNKYVDSFLKSLLAFITASAGVGLGVAGMKIVPSFGTNDTINKAAPGVIAGIGAFALSTFVDNKHVKMVSLGIGIAAVLTLIEKFTAGSTNETVKSISSLVPKLGAAQGYNPGDVSADYYLNMDRAGRPLGALPARALGGLPARSLGNATNKAYGLMGNAAMGLQGATNKAYGLM